MYIYLFKHTIIVKIPPEWKQITSTDRTIVNVTMPVLVSMKGKYCKCLVELYVIALIESVCGMLQEPGQRRDARHVI